MSFHKKDQFGNLKKSSVAYANFQHAKLCGYLHPNHTWEQANARYRKKLRKKKIAQLSRRANRVG
ncbi:MAG: hypothetical protein HY348_06420 [Nitrospira defluvii]|nr:hypothetical protein [Nitrospira defluvii]